MIKELELIELEEYANLENHYGHKALRIPNNRELMNKINEIIRYINAQEVEK